MDNNAQNKETLSSCANIIHKICKYHLDGKFEDLKNAILDEINKVYEEDTEHNNS